MSPSNTVTVAPVCTHGANGSTGKTTNSTTAGDGVVTAITGTPSLPLIAHLENTPASLVAEIAARFRTGNYHEQLNLVQQAHEVCELQAAWNAKPGEFNNLRMALYFGGKSEREIGQLSYMQVKPGIRNPYGEHEWLEIPVEQCVLLDDTLGGRI